MTVGTLGLPIVDIDAFPYLANDYEVKLFLTFTKAAQETTRGAALISRLMEDTRAQNLNKKMLSSGTGGSILETERLAAWWLWRANDTGEDEANKNLDEFLDSNYIDVFGVLWIYGVQASKSIQITEDIILVPVGEMPASGDKEQFLLARFRRDHAFIPVPTAALVKQYKTEKIVTTEPTSTSFTTGMEVARQLQDAALLLNCVPDVCSAAGFSTSYTAPSVPLGPFGGRGGGSPMYDVVPSRISSVGSDCAEGFSALFDGYRRLSVDDRSRVQRALYRFAQAKARFSDGDRALDLGIALEMLLLGPEHQGQEFPGQLSLHFRLRGSWLIAGSATERREIYAQLGKIYSLRSQIAHNGVSRALSKMPSEKRARMFSQHERIAERILSHLILHGFPDDWTNLVLGHRPAASAG